MQAISDRRPLVIESIIALRRRCGSYQRAVELFEQHGGDTVREYVFKREWDSLPANNHARYLLSALANLNQPATLDDLEIILKYDISIITDSIAAVNEMFLETNEIGEETAFEIGTLTRTFILTQARNLDRFEIIIERVKSFQRPFHPKKPILNRLIVKVQNSVERAINACDQSSLELAWADLIAAESKAQIGQDPRYLAFKGYIATQMEPVKITEAREGFSDAMKMGFEPDIHHLLVWYVKEQRSGYGSEQCEQIINFVSKSRGYSRSEKLNFEVREAARLYTLGKDLRFDAPEKSIKILEKALQLHLRNFRIGIRISYANIIKVEEYTRNTAFLLFMVENTGAIIHH